MTKNSVVRSLSQIEDFFNRAHQKVYKLSELRGILNEQRHLWDLHRNISISEVIHYLVEQGRLSTNVLSLGSEGSRKETRFIWGHVSSYEVALSLQPDSYLSHHTAMYLNGLSEQEPDIIYVNHEQPKHRTNTDELIQENIDRAFRNAVRVSNNIAIYQGTRICLLNGMNTGQCGVSSFIGMQNENLRLTGIARTLIDIAVRPVYSGGIENVLMAYRLAKEKVIVGELVELLQKLQYKYPYHQVVGFYLEQSNAFKEDEIKAFYDFEMKYDFYLVHEIKEMAYSAKWHLYYPKKWESA